MRCLDGIIDSMDMNHHLTTEQQPLREDALRDKVSLIVWRTVKKTENEIEISEREASPLESVPEAGISRILKSLCDPISTNPTRKSGQIVYGCALLLGEQWNFSLIVF